MGIEKSSNGTGAVVWIAVATAAFVTDTHLPPIPEPATKLFKKCAGALLEVDGDHDDKVVDELWKAITEDGWFDPHTQQEQEWIQRTLLDYLSLYRYGLVENIMQQGSEMGYVVRFLSNLDKCLDDVALTLR